MKLPRVLLTILVLGFTPTGESGAQQPAEAKRLPSSLVFCRWVEDGRLYFRGWECLRDGKKTTIDATNPNGDHYSESPADDIAEDADRRPQSFKIHEGTKIEILVVKRKADGLVLNIGVDQAVSRPRGVEIHQACRKGVFLAFNHALHIPLSVGDPGSRAPGVDFFLGDGETIHFDLPIPDEFRQDFDADRERAFRKIGRSGANVTCQRCTVWERLRGRSLAEEIGLDYLLEPSNLAQLWQQLTGEVTWLSALAPLLEDELWSHEIESALLGSASICTIQMSDSPTLLQDIQSLRDIPDLHSLVIYADEIDDEVRNAVAALHVPHVHYLSLAERAENAVSTNGQEIAYVDAVNAEQTIPQLRDMRSTEHVLISAFPDQAELAKKAQAALQQALPNLEVHAVLHVDSANHD